MLQQPYVGIDSRSASVEALLQTNYEHHHPRPRPCLYCLCDDYFVLGLLAKYAPVIMGDYRRCICFGAFLTRQGLICGRFGNMPFPRNLYI